MKFRADQLGAVCNAAVFFPAQVKAFRILGTEP
jgi:hypothetical protein